VTKAESWGRWGWLVRQGDDGVRGLSESVQLSLDRGSLGAKAMPPAVTKAMHAALVDGARDLGVPAAVVEAEFVRPVVRSVQEAMGVCAVAFGPMGTREQVCVCSLGVRSGPMPFLWRMASDLFLCATLALHEELSLRFALRRLHTRRLVHLTTF
jgi:hypothetical protein